MSINESEYNYNLASLQAALRHVEGGEAHLTIAPQQITLTIADKTVVGSRNIARVLDKTMERYYDED